MRYLRLRYVARVERVEVNVLFLPLCQNARHLVGEVAECPCREAGGVIRQHRAGQNGSLYAAGRDDGECHGQRALTHARNVLNGQKSFVLHNYITFIFPLLFLRVYAGGSMIFPFASFKAPIIVDGVVAQVAKAVQSYKKQLEKTVVFALKVTEKVDNCSLMPLLLVSIKIVSTRFCSEVSAINLIIMGKTLNVIQNNIVLL